MTSLLRLRDRAWSENLARGNTPEHACQATRVINVRMTDDHAIEMRDTERRKGGRNDPPTRVHFRAEATACIEEQGVVRSSHQHGQTLPDIERVNLEVANRRRLLRRDQQHRCQRKGRRTYAMGQRRENGKCTNNKERGQPARRRLHGERRPRSRSKVYYQVEQMPEQTKGRSGRSRQRHLYTERQQAQGQSKAGDQRDEQHIHERSEHGDPPESGEQERSKHEREDCLCAQYS